ncbi:MAG: ribosome silencing factor [Armatimonadetes bacterium]|nr:ribosome silencing factor [Armatimonadota bacterium]
MRLVANIADTMKATDITVLDLRPLTTIADFFLICTGNSSIQIRGIAGKIEEKLRENGMRKLRMEGFREATWILLDYGDVIVHIMAEEQRAYYQLEEFWKDAEQLPLDFTPEDLSARTVYIRDLED